MKKGKNRKKQREKTEEQIVEEEEKGSVNERGREGGVGANGEHLGRRYLSHGVVTSLYLVPERRYLAIERRRRRRERRSCA